MNPVLLVEPDATYREHRECLTSHQLGDFRRCPALYKARMDGEEAPDSTAYRMGRAIHALTLEGEGAFSAAYTDAEGPINPRTHNPYGPTSKAYQEWAAGIDQEILTPTAMELVRTLAAAVHAHPVAAPLLAEGQAEGVIRQEFHGLKAQSRLDWYGPRGIVDLKTCRDLDRFEADASAYGYVYQMAFYWDMLQRFLGEEAPVYMVAAEKEAPYRCGVWRVPEPLLVDAAATNARAIARLRKCRDTDTWPTGYEELRKLEMM